MVTVEVVGLKDVKKLLLDMPEVGRKVVSRSINDTTRKTKTNISKTVRLKSTVKASYAKEQITVSRKARVNDLVGAVKVRGNKIKAIGYRSSQNKKGVRTKVFKQSDPIVYPRAFIAKMKSGHKGVFWRKKADNPTNKYPAVTNTISKVNNLRLYRRLPIEELYSYSIPELVDDDRVWTDIQENAKNYLDDRISHHYSYYIGRV